MKAFKKFEKFKKINIEKIIIHPGQFHADDILAATLLDMVSDERAYKGIFRRIPTKEDLDNPKVAVIDIGRRYEPVMMNFDHHQDENLPASNMLVLNYVEASGLIPPEICDSLRYTLFNFVSDNDIGNIDFESVRGVPTFSSMIRSLNGLGEGALKAIAFAAVALNGAVNSAIIFEETKYNWQSYEKIGRIAIGNSKEFLVGWKGLAVKEGIDFLLSENIREPGKWQIITSGDHVKITVDERQTFLHNAKFMAVYENKKAAMDHAIQMTQEKI